jgi:hypothetical protein
LSTAAIGAEDGTAPGAGRGWCLWTTSAIHRVSGTDRVSLTAKLLVTALPGAAALIRIVIVRSLIALLLEVVFRFEKVCSLAASKFADESAALPSARRLLSNRPLRLAFAVAVV